MDKTERKYSSKLKDALVDEATTFVPFACITEKYNRRWGAGMRTPGELNTIQKINWLRRVGFNAGFSRFGTTYLATALFSRTNPLDPKAILDAATITNEEKRADIPKEFYRVDSNGDYVIDPNEFYDWRSPQYR